MIQNLLSLLAVLAALSYTVFSIIKLFDKKKDTSCNCGSCDVKSEINKLKSLKKI